MPVTPSSKFLADRLRELRDRHGLTQAALAEILQIPERNYQRFESGGRDVKLSTLEKLAAPFGLEGRQLLADEIPITRMQQAPAKAPHRSGPGKQRLSGS